jgi:hypothetical protein
LFDYCPTLKEKDHHSPRITDLERLFNICMLFIKMNLVSVPLALLQANPGLLVIKNKEGANLLKASVKYNIETLLVFFSSLPNPQKKLLIEGWNTEPLLLYMLRCE